MNDELRGKVKIEAEKQLSRNQFLIPNSTFLINLEVILNGQKIFSGRFDC